MEVSLESTEGSDPKRRPRGAEACSASAQVNRRGLIGVAAYLVPIALWLASAMLASSPAFTQQAVRRAGQERDVDALEQRRRTLSRLLLSSTRNLSTAKIDGGRVDGELTVHTGKLEVGSIDFENMERLAPGEVQAITMAAANKFSTDLALVFSDTKLPASKASAESGVFSVWLKRVEDGWHLVFNREADVWGTQRDPAMDVAEAALSYQESEDSTEELTPALTMSGTKGQLGLSWGRHRWTAAFTVEGP